MALVSVIMGYDNPAFTMVEREKGKMTVEEAGHLGGEKGGQKVKRLIEEGKVLEREKRERRR